jgi:hypothetical protein
VYVYPLLYIGIEPVYVVTGKSVVAVNVKIVLQISPLRTTSVNGTLKLCPFFARFAFNQYPAK